jgi:hypothetical protein
MEPMASLVFPQGPRPVVLLVTAGLVAPTWIQLVDLEEVVVMEVTLHR